MPVTSDDLKTARDTQLSIVRLYKDIYRTIGFDSVVDASVADGSELTCKALEALTNAGVLRLTIGARYKDRAALVGIENVKNLVSASFGKLLLWVWTKEVTDDLRTIFQ